ncbi:oligoribonuclease [Leucobacter salsicius]|uniref:oligoribonuclease n=1 Tax=Leucobacter salsicius TaxID=664638 RepID=UPI00034BABC4|nr:oligoribonuclease [Leucobacter salsicius]
MQELNAGPIAWIDIETTGLDRDQDLILEVAAVITDAELNEVAHFSEVVHQDRALAVSMMDKAVLQMHTRSGLIADLAVTSSASSIVEIEQRLLEFVAEHRALDAPVAGSNVSFDRGFLELWMPTLNDQALHYRSIDVSTVKELARRWAPHVLETAPPKDMKHRALADIRESIAELRHYRAAGLLTPTTNDTAALAAGEGMTR